MEEHKELQYDIFDQSSNHPSPKKFGIEKYLRFFFIVDSLNFCFWKSGIEYKDLVEKVTWIFEKQPQYFSCGRFNKLDLSEFEQ